LLATHPDTTREAAITALWPDASIEAGRRNLRSTLNVLNGVLEPNRVGGDAPYFIRSVGQRLRLVLDEHLTIDVVEFERLLDRADEEERAGAPSLAIEPLRAAAALYQGDLLPDSYDDWVLFARDRLRARYVRAAVRCGELLVASGRTDEAIAIITPALAIEPWSEPGHRALVSAHLRNDDAASARRAMITCREVLSEIGGPSERLTQMLERRLEQLA
jgi:DNA-binding SARP family transcriptional activator